MLMDGELMEYICQENNVDGNIWWANNAETRKRGRQETNMKIALNILGVLLVLFGAIWFFQGVNLLPGSFMSGQIRWAVYGGIAVVVGICLLLSARRRRAH